MCAIGKGEVDLREEPLPPRNVLVEGTRTARDVRNPIGSYFGDVQVFKETMQGVESVRIKTGLLATVEVGTGLLSCLPRTKFFDELTTPWVIQLSPEELDRN